MWGARHFLLFWERTSLSRTLLLALLLAQLFSWLPAYRVLMVWVYEHTESLLLTMLMHASLVASVTVVLAPSVTGVNLLIYILTWATALWLVVAAVVMVNDRRFLRQPLQMRGLGKGGTML